jgi:hypothetical protein
MYLLGVSDAKAGNIPLHLAASANSPGLQARAPDTVGVLLEFCDSTSRLGNKSRQATVSMMTFL